MGSRKVKAGIATGYYAIVFVLVACHQDMWAMWGMALGMLVGAGVQLLPTRK